MEKISLKLLILKALLCHNSSVCKMSAQLVAVQYLSCLKIDGMLIEGAFPPIWKAALGLIKLFSVFLTSWEWGGYKKCVPHLACHFYYVWSPGGKCCTVFGKPSFPYVDINANLSYFYVELNGEFFNVQVSIRCPLTFLGLVCLFCVFENLCHN